MSVVLGTECPHCRHRVGAEFQAEWVTPIEKRNFWTVTFKCTKCQRGIFATLNPLRGYTRPSEGNGDVAQTPAFQVVEIYPRIPEPDIPPYLPKNIEIFYKEARDNEIHENWNSCGTMCRKVVDVATKHLGAKPDSKITARFRELESAKKITPDLATWGQAIWKDGNDASHDSDPFTEPEARQIRAFTELFLMYVYTLPGMLNERKTRISPTP